MGESPFPLTNCDQGTIQPALVNLGGKMEINPFKDILQLEGLENKGSRRKGGEDRGKNGNLLS